MKEILVNDIVYREDLYPRFSPNQETIQKYAYSIEYLPPIIINQNNILIDGYHRWKAHQLEKKETIKVEIRQTNSEKELKMLAYKYNSHHGLQLSSKEKKSYAQEMIGEQLNIEELANILSVNQRTIIRWTENQRKEQKEKQKRDIINLYLRAWNTQETISEIMDIPRQTISDTIVNFAENGQLSNFGKNFKPLLYNIWNLKEQDNKTESHFGSFPCEFMKNLLYYHTEPFDIIYDPFAGGGTTVDICKETYRRYYCSDIQVRPGRESDIKEWDITEGLPDDLRKPDLVFLDPPYWKQAKGKYTEKETDLSNMSLEDFYDSMEKLLNNLIRKKTERIAIVISPTEYSNENHIYEDHIFKIYDMINKDKYEIEKRYILPYSTQQYNGTQVQIMKKEKKTMSLHRDLVVWKLKEEK